MTKNQRIVWISGFAAVVVLVAVFVFSDLFQSSSRTIPCDDGPRQTIDIRDFVIQYSAYSVEFESRIGEKVELSGKLDPVKLQSLTEAAQQSNEFRKYLVAGYNACAISKQQYGEFGRRFQALDGIARQIDTLAGSEALDESGRQKLADLVDRYVELTAGLGS